MSINRVVVSGNLTRDPELRVTPGGTQGDERARRLYMGTFHSIFSRILRKGMKVAIEGKLRYSSWEDKNGDGRRSKVEIIPDEVVLMSQNPNGQQAPQQYAPQGYQQQAYPPRQAPQPAPQWNAQQAYQQAPQAVPQPAPQQAAPQPAPAQQQLDVYDEDIPF